MKTVALSEVASINPREPSVPPDQEVSFVGLAELDAATAVARPREARTFSEALTGYTIFRNQDILAAKISPSWENGKVGQAELDHPIGVGSTEFHFLRPGPELDNRYLLHLLRQPSLRLTGELRMTGSAGQKRVPAEFLRSLQIVLPPLGEQRRIAAILDRINQIRSRYRETLALLQSLGETRFREKFGDLPASATVDELAARGKGSIRTGPFGSQLLHSEFVEEGVPVLGLDNIVSNTFREGGGRFVSPEKYKALERYTVFPGDALISIMGTVGRCAVVPEGAPTAINTKHICAITLDQRKILPEFLRASFLWHRDSVRHLRQQTKGSIMAGLNMGIIKTMPVPVPDLAQQQIFVDELKVINNQGELVGRALAAYDELFTSLQSRAFRGEL